jgi:hypothetical protein
MAEINKAYAYASSRRDGFPRESREQALSVPLMGCPRGLALTELLRASKIAPRSATGVPVTTVGGRVFRDHRFRGFVFAGIRPPVRVLVLQS